MLNSNLLIFSLSWFSFSKKYFYNLQLFYEKQRLFCKTPYNLNACLDFDRIDSWYKPVFTL